MHGPLQDRAARPGGQSVPRFIQSFGDIRAHTWAQMLPARFNGVSEIALVVAQDGGLTMKESAPTFSWCDRLSSLKCLRQRAVNKVHFVQTSLQLLSDRWCVHGGVVRVLGQGTTTEPPITRLPTISAANGIPQIEDVVPQLRCCRDLRYPAFAGLPKSGTGSLGYKGNLRS